MIPFETPRSCPAILTSIFSGIVKVSSTVGSRSKCDACANDATMRLRHCVCRKSPPTALLFSVYDSGECLRNPTGLLSNARLCWGVVGYNLILGCEVFDMLWHNKLRPFVPVLRKPPRAPASRGVFSSDFNTTALSCRSLSNLGNKKWLNRTGFAFSARFVPTLFFNRFFVVTVFFCFVVLSFVLHIVFGVAPIYTCYFYCLFLYFGSGLPLTDVFCCWLMPRCELALSGATFSRVLWQIAFITQCSCHQRSSFSATTALYLAEPDPPT